MGNIIKQIVLSSAPFFMMCAKGIGNFIEIRQLPGDTWTGNVCFKLALVGVGTVIIDQVFSNLHENIYNEYVKVIQDSEVQVTLIG